MTEEQKTRRRERERLYRIQQAAAVDFCRERGLLPEGLDYRAQWVRTVALAFVRQAGLLPSSSRSERHWK